MIRIDNVHFTKYKGINFGSGHMEEGANVRIYQKPAMAVEPAVTVQEGGAASSEAVQAPVQE